MRTILHGIALAVAMTVAGVAEETREIKVYPLVSADPAIAVLFGLSIVF